MSMRLTVSRRISAPETSTAFRCVLKSGYFPVPSNNLEWNECFPIVNNLTASYKLNKFYVIPVLDRGFDDFL